MHHGGAVGLDGVEPLGQGGMGQVFLAQDATLDRKVALKFLPDRLEQDKKARTRFLREAKSAAALDHPYICKIYEIGEAEGRAFIAMEYVEGMTLARKLTAGAMRIPDILDLGAEMGEAVDAAHKKGIVHRDLKPANIMVTPDGHIKILDFGVAKKIALDGLVDDGAQTASEQLTAHNATPGTVICMSPEQVRGETIDGRTDIFSLGTVLYEMATGAAPFEGATAGLVYDAILNRTPASPRSINLNVPADLERIVQKALEKDRENRYQKAQELVVDLRRLKRDTGSVPESYPKVTTTGKRRRVWAPVVAAAAILVAIAATILSLRPPATSGTIDSLAVLPFENTQDDREVDYLADGIAESLINRLSELPQLQVMARSTSFRFRGSDVDPRVAGRELGVGAVLTGRVEQREDSLNVQAELVDVKSGSQLWGEQYNREMADLVQVQNDIARDISRALRLKLSGEEQVQLAEATEDSAAYQAYLKGRFLLNRRRQVDIENAVTFFEEAKASDPNFALAHVGLGDSYIVIGAQWYGVDPDNPPAVAMAKARTAAREALRLDPALAEGYVTMAYIEFLQDWDWDAAEKDFLKAIELKPNYVVAHQWYAEFLVVTGRHEEGIAENMRAIELEPASSLQNRELANSYMRTGQYAEAIVQLKKTDELDPSHSATLVSLAQAYWLNGMPDEAIAVASREDARWRQFYTLLAEKKNEEASAVIDAFEELTDQNKIVSYAMASDSDKFLSLLEVSFRRHYVILPGILENPVLAPWSSDERIVQLRRNVGLEW
ncbi:MAG: protein kinase [Acidobacteria bacterium]|nr:MAG: protein kinase [Acidobacteriota bacterium]